MIPDIYLRLAIALSLGLLIGLQRERVGKQTAGIRTFALIALTGFVTGLLAETHGAWILASAILFLAAVICLGTWISHCKSSEEGAGITTETATLVLFATTAYLVEGEKAIAVILAGLTTILLHYKTSMHRFVRGLGDPDLHAIMQFVLISLVILPILPRQTYGPYQVLSPFNVWLMVVLIVGIGLAGYVAYKLFGGKKGTVLNGLLGGLISSTATTVASAREAKTRQELLTPAAIVIMIAAAVSLVRVLIEVAAVGGRHFPAVAPPLSVFLGLLVLLTGVLYFRRASEIGTLAPPENPAQLKPAVIFGLLYAIVLLAVAAAKDTFGEKGLYVVAVLSGLTDMDAITLSTCRLMNEAKLEPDTGWRVILIAAMANLVFKAGIVAAIGPRALLRSIAILYALAIAGGIVLVFLWP